MEKMSIKVGVVAGEESGRMRSTPFPIFKMSTILISLSVMF